VLALLLSLIVWAQVSDGARTAILIGGRYSVLPDIVYARSQNHELKLDVYKPTSSVQPASLVMYIHGGGWATGSKGEEMLAMLPYLEAGWAGINVELCRIQDLIDRASAGRRGGLPVRSPVASPQRPAI